MLMNWRDVPEWEGEYQVSDTGLVRSLDRECVVHRSNGKSETRRHKGKLLKAHVLKNGYAAVCFTRPGGERADTYVHRLVLAAFAGEPPPGLESCHNNGVRIDNRLENLRYDTRSANALDRHAHGTMNQAKGSAHFFSKLTEDDVRWIRAQAGRATQRDLAQVLGVSHGTVGNVIRGKQWAHVA